MCNFKRACTANMVSISAKLCQDTFQTVPSIQLFDGESFSFHDFGWNIMFSYVRRFDQLEANVLQNRLLCQIYLRCTYPVVCMANDH